MKQIIFKGKYGWYIPATNYKDKTDTAYINLFFAKCDTPVADKRNTNGTEFTWVELKNYTYSCYKGKIGITVFDYEQTCSPKESADTKTLVKEFAQDNKIELDNIDQEALPFY